MKDEIEWATESNEFTVRDKRGEKEQFNQAAYHHSVGEMLEKINNQSAASQKSIDEEIKDCFMVPGPGRVVVLPDSFRYRGTLIIPDSGKRTGTTGRVLIVGDGDRPTFNGKPIEVKDRVAYGTWTGTQFSFDGRPSYRLLGFDEIASVITDDNVKLLDVEA